MQLAVKVIAMPKDCNADGDIFGGWIMSMMDLAGSTLAKMQAKTRIVTVSATGIDFHLPVHVGDHVECYVEQLKLGNSSMTVRVEVQVERRTSGLREKVTEGVFTYVALGPDKKPVRIPR